MKTGIVEPLKTIRILQAPKPNHNNMPPFLCQTGFLKTWMIAPYGLFALHFFLFLSIKSLFQKRQNTTLSKVACLIFKLIA